MLTSRPCSIPAASNWMSSQECSNSSCECLHNSSADRAAAPSRCGRGIPHGQETRFCCSGADFVCGGAGNGTVDGSLGGGTGIDGGSGGSGSRKQIDCARVNDNYPDCPDGSDEPGTSASSHLVRSLISRAFKMLQSLLSFADHGCAAKSLAWVSSFAALRPAESSVAGAGFAEAPVVDYVVPKGASVHTIASVTHCCRRPPGMQTP